ncbi:uncharacterized protein [Prorops nasuta]|uniref:uncharacterized protein n=1 Tax=Prorops nasuta TaxID=863751 RepID=UPI0034CDB223
MASAGELLEAINYVPMIRDEFVRLVVNIKKRGVHNFTLPFLEDRLAALEKWLNVLHKTHVKITTHTKPAELAKMEYVTDSWYQAALDAHSDAEEFILGHLDELPPNQGMSASGPTAPSGEINHIRLPVIDLPKFSGDYLEWNNFYETFSSIVHDKVYVSGRDKFHYLKSCLQGEAATVIKSLAITSENYEIAWDTLVARYTDKRMITDTFLDQISQVPTLRGNKHKTSKKESGRSLKSHAASVNSTGCAHCGSNHFLYQCKDYLALTPQARSKFAFSQNLCINCLRPGHSSSNCSSSSRCRKCSKMHHTLLHFDKSGTGGCKSRGTTPAANSASEPEPSSSHSTTHLSVTDTRSVLLDTFSARIDAPDGSRIILRIPRKRINATIHGVALTSAQNVRAEAQITLHSLSRHGVSLDVTAIILPTITQYLPPTYSRSSFPSLSGIDFADNFASTKVPIDVLIGADYLTSVVEGPYINSPDNSLRAQRTIFGWIVAGVVPKAGHSHSLTVHHCFDLENTLRDFWELEEVPEVKPMSTEDSLCEQHFVDTVTRTPSGRFVVALPFRSDIEKHSLGSSSRVAEKTLSRILRRLETSPDQAESYSQFLQEYIMLGHMSPVPMNSDFRVFLPHHAVFKTDNQKTKIRVVLNASSKTSTGVSLNDTLFIGPKLQQDITRILMNWRSFRYVGVTDIVKMFRQILMRFVDRKYQNILWKTDSGALQAFELNTVTYGTGPAPFLSSRVLRELAYTDGANFPLTQDVLLNSTYVDDILFGAHDLKQLSSTLRIPRWTGQSLTTGKRELIGFCDASELAYGAVVYERLTDEDGQLSVHLVMSKTKVAPIKTTSIPRLELVAAALLVKLLVHVKGSLVGSCDAIRCYSDSQVALAWIAKQPVHWKTGTSAQQLSEDSLWWHGPAFLREHTVNPVQIFETAEESRKSKLVRVMAYVLRFVQRTRKTGQWEDSLLSASEIRDSIVAIVQVVQRTHFADELSALNHGSRILRIGGRLRNAEISEQMKHPIILPDCHLTAILIRQTHLDTLHGGLQLTLSTLRQKFWVVNARTLVKACVHKCITFTFEHTGVDYAGPFLVKLHHGRNAKSVKCYVAVFVCLATRAVHLELVSRLDTEAFLAALTRFISRRGKPAVMYSDNGLNFQGADAELKRAYRCSLEAARAQNTDSISKIEWKFIPVATPHWGGLWESAVKSMKHHLKRSLGVFVPNFEEIATLLTKIEACLNSRPISRLHDDPESLDVLTPGPKWQNSNSEFGEGDLVLVKVPNNPPRMWTLGRILKLVPGVDGVARVAILKTARKEIQRSLSQLCKLPS